MTCSHTSCPPGGPCRQTGIPEVTVIPMAPPTFRPGLDEPLSPEIGVGSTGLRLAEMEAEVARLRADKAALLAEHERLREALEGARLVKHGELCNVPPPDMGERGPSDECDCGADEHNARIDAALRGEG